MMSESGIEADLDPYNINMDELPDYDGPYGELKSTNLTFKSTRSEVKHANTPLKVNLKMELQKMQLQDEQKRQHQQQQKNSVASRIPSTDTRTMPISMPSHSVNEVSLPSHLMKVNTGLEFPTQYHLKQKRNYQIQNYLSQSVHSAHSVPVQKPQPSPGALTPTSNHLSRQHHSSSSMPDPTSPLSMLSTSGVSVNSEQGSPSYSYMRLNDHPVDEFFNDISEIQRGDGSVDPDLNAMLVQLSATVPENDMLDSGSLTNLHQTSISAPTSNDLAAWCKERQRKDNHNQIERKRRYNINDRIKELGTLLPNTSDPDFRQNKGTILKASVDYIKDLKRDQARLRHMEEKMKEQERQNRLIMLRLQQCEMMLKTTGLQGNTGITHIDHGASAAVKSEPMADAMDDDMDSPIANDLMLSASLRAPDSFSIEDAMNSY